eukprot:ANDGO_07547.mRNA.1 hypothetical protein
MNPATMLAIQKARELPNGRETRDWFIIHVGDQKDASETTTDFVAGLRVAHIPDIILLQERDATFLLSPPSQIALRSLTLISSTMKARDRCVPFLSDGMRMPTQSLLHPFLCRSRLLVSLTSTLGLPLHSSHVAHSLFLQCHDMPLARV